MSRQQVLLANIILLLVALACQAAPAQGRETGPQHSTAELRRARLMLELDRAILVLKQGAKENWATRDRYLTAFERTPSTDSTGLPVTNEKRQVECAIAAELRIHRPWDEGPPMKVEVQSALSEFTKKRESRVVELPVSICAVPAPQTVVVSAGVAASMLETRIDPVYPSQALRNHLSGTVLIHATISSKGHPEDLRVISGPTLLQQAALDAVQRWTYRSYLLNDQPVEVETTIKVDFAPQPVSSLISTNKSACRKLSHRT